MREEFTASVQYNDFKGSVAADEADGLQVANFLRERNLIGDADHVIGIKFWSGEIYCVAHCFVVPLANWGEIAQKNPVPVRQVSVELSPEEFFSLFKRFEIALSWRGADLDGREIEYEEE